MAPSPEIEPRTASFFVTWRKILLPSPVNCMVTIGWPVVGSKSCCVPESFRSLPVRFGYGPVLIVRVRAVLEEVVVVLAGGRQGAARPSGHTVVVSAEQVMTTVWAGTGKTLSPFGTLPS